MRGVKQSGDIYRSGLLRRYAPINDGEGVRAARTFSVFFEKYLKNITKNIIMFSIFAIDFLFE
jgi:hypothetical protein